ncbi:hypothetical protein POVWA2_001440 [Plasmodium ovale wallikeri]|uniref:Uncharacterized protein n=1 Tax=Plasmodium ovale wallikeri TaxID=864142 RepID=A0A1A8YH92_PLAOA|nr:hypothetical protein POVWA2_001440 [Plasmodium ovale wallikeri]
MCEQNVRVKRADIFPSKATWQLCKKKKKNRKLALRLLEDSDAAAVTLPITRKKANTDAQVNGKVNPNMYGKNWLSKWRINSDKMRSIKFR